MVLADERGELGDRLALLTLAERRIDDRGVQHLTGRIHDGDLAAVAVAGVESHGDEAFDGRLHEQRLEVEGKVADRGFVGRVGEQIADLPFQAREDQPVVAVLSGGCNECHGGAAGLDDKAAERLDRGVAIHVEADLQKALFLAAVERQNLMALQFCNRLGKLVIEAIDGIRVRVGGLGAGRRTLLHQPAQ